MDARTIAENEFVDDPAGACPRRGRGCRRRSRRTTTNSVTADWVTVFGPSKLSGMIDSAGFTGQLLTAPLETADIPHVWDPYPPEEMPAFRVGYGAVDRPFSLSGACGPG